MDGGPAGRAGDAGCAIRAHVRGFAAGLRRAATCAGVPSRGPFLVGDCQGPASGAGAGQGFNLNLPLPARASVAAWFDALEQACARIGQHGADALVVSLGLDTFAGDPISTFALQAGDFTRLGQRLARVGLPTAFILEGGYAAAELGENAARVIEGFEA